MKRLLLPVTVAVMAGLLWGSVTPARACSCAVRPVAERVQFYDKVVIGTVLRLTDDPNVSFSDKDAVVSVERYLKGSGPKEVVADDPVGDADCGFFGEASVGERYILFLSEESSSLSTHLCAGNELASDAFVAEVEAIAGAGLPPEEAGPVSEEQGSSFPVLSVAVAATLGTVAFLVGAAFVRRRDG